MNYNLQFVETIPPGAIVLPLDASSLKASKCQQQYVYSIVRGMRTAAVSEPQAMGKAIHKFAEGMMRDPDDMMAALRDAKAEWNLFSPDNKILTAVCGAMPIGALPVPARWTTPEGTHDGVESFFRVPWLAFTYEGQAYCIVLMGTIDLISFNDVVVSITDWKSSRKWKKEEVFDQYQNDSQFFFYMWVLYKFGYSLKFEKWVHAPEDDGRTASKLVSYSLDPAMAQAARDLRIDARACAVQLMTNPRWTLAPTQGLSPRRAELFEEELLTHIHTDLIPAWLTPENAARNGWISGVCAQCNFNMICHVEDEAMYNQILQYHYVRKPYNPQSHTK